MQSQIKNPQPKVKMRPTDQYRTVKCSFESIINPELDISILHDAMMRTHKLFIHVCQFLRLFVLYCYHEKKDILTIDTNVLDMALLALRKPSCGPKPKNINGEYYKVFMKFRKYYYDALNYPEPEDGVNLSHILGYISTEIVTNINNNIQLNFEKYVKRFVNSSYKLQIEEILKPFTGKQRTNIRKALNRELMKVKEDILTNSSTADPKYLKFIETSRANIFPKDMTESYTVTMKNSPQKFFKGMIYMCLELEKIGTKAFQFFPLRTNIVPKILSY